MGFIRALIVLHRAYRHFPLRARVHVLIRFLTCPFLRVVQYVPPGARLLDLGAGHGVFSVLARERGADVTAVDPDMRKVGPLAGIRRVVGFDDCIRGRFEAIAIIDALYTIPITAWDALLDRLTERLQPGGILLIKEHDPSARFKQAWNRLQERIVSPLRLTLAESFSYETPAEFIARLQRHGLQDVQAIPLHRGYPHPHLLYVARRRVAGTGREAITGAQEEIQVVKRSRSDKSKDGSGGTSPGEGPGQSHFDHCRAGRYPAAFSSLGLHTPEEKSRPRNRRETRH